MRTCIALALWLVCIACLAQAPPADRPQNRAAYPEPEAAGAWRSLAAGYLRKALKDNKLDRDPVLNARVDAVMSGVGVAAGRIDPRFSGSAWKVFLIEDFGHGAVAFPGETILMDAKFVRSLRLNDDELALVLSHEAAHLIAGHAFEKLSFMAAILGREKASNARAALLEFFVKDAYAEAFRPVAQLQEREADRIGAAVLLGSGYDAARALALFDKLAAFAPGDGPDTHDPPLRRKAAIAAELARLRAAVSRGSP